MSDQTPDTRVLYNAACPICDAEIRHYARYTQANGLPVAYDDLNTGARDAWGIDSDTAMRRLHVLKDGEILSGLDAFRALWSRMPRYRWLARLTGLPLIRPLAAATYDRILAPWLYRRHLRRLARDGAVLGSQASQTPKQESQP